jgi:hypothetical protein
MDKKFSVSFLDTCGLKYEVHFSELEEELLNQGSCPLNVTIVGSHGSVGDLIKRIRL